MPQTLYVHRDVPATITINSRALGARVVNTASVVPTSDAEQQHLQEARISDAFGVQRAVFSTVDPKFLDDQFTWPDNDTLQTHGWTKHASSTGDATITSNRVRDSGNFVANYYPAAAVADAVNYDVEAYINKVSALGAVGIFLGIDTALMNGYLLQWGAALASWVLYRADNNVFTQIGGSYADNPANGTNRTALLRRRGTNLYGYVDGALQIGPVVDATYTAIGRPGIRLGNSTNSTGGHIDWCRAYNAP